MKYGSEASTSFWFEPTPHISGYTLIESRLVSVDGLKIRCLLAIMTRKRTLCENHYSQLHERLQCKFLFFLKTTVVRQNVRSVRSGNRLHTEQKTMHFWKCNRLAASVSKVASFKRSSITRQKKLQLLPYNTGVWSCGTFAASRMDIESRLWNAISNPPLQWHHALCKWSFLPSIIALSPSFT